MDPFSSNTPWVASSSKSRRSRVVLIALAVLVLIVLAAVAFLHFSPLKYGLFGNDSFLRLAQGTPPESVTLWTPDGSVAPESAVPGTLIDYARAGSLEVAIVRNGEGQYDVYELGSEQKRLTTDGSPKGMLAVSADGQYVAFATFLSELQGPVTSLSRWEVELYDRSTNLRLALGNGAAPSFFERDGNEYLFFSSPGGVSVVDPSEQTVHVTEFAHTDDLTAAVIDSTGMHVALRDQNGYVVHMVASAYPEVMVENGVQLAEDASSAAFRDGMFYGLSGTALTAYDLPDLAAGDVYEVPENSYLLP